jgi:hypothetical protein
MPLYPEQRIWLSGVIAGLTALSDNRWMMPSDHLAAILNELGSVIESCVPGAVVEMGNCLPLPIIHVGFFSEQGDHPDPIAFALIDCDAHDSVATCLRIAWPRLSPGGTVVIHDYRNPMWPGVEKACTSYFLSRENELETVKVLLGSMLVVTKRSIS